LQNRGYFVAVRKHWQRGGYGGYRLVAVTAIGVDVIVITVPCTESSAVKITVDTNAFIIKISMS
jgi:hypothetical protein